MAPNAATTTHTQVRETKAVQPSRRSCSIDVGSTRAPTARSRRPMQTAAIAQVSASTASAHPDPTVTTSTPALLGPSTMAP